MNILEVQGLSKTYGSGETAVHALRNVSFSVPKGEFVAIVGESGSGKSTLLNMIGALDTPTDGKVFIVSVAAGVSGPVKRMSDMSVTETILTIS